jgi:gliding motility-associated-like protein
MNKSTYTNKKIIGALIFFAVAFFQSGIVSAQYVSRLGKFKVDQIRGCAPFTINITDTNVITTGQCTTQNPCSMTYESLNGITNPKNTSCFTNCFQYTFDTPGTYTVSVLYQNVGADDITITVDTDVKPDYEVYSCNGSKVAIKITDKTYDQYFIDFDNNGSIDKSLPSGNNVTAQFSYPASGNYFISVNGKRNNSANNCSAMIKPFTAIATLPAKELSALASIDKNDLKIDFTPDNNIQYKLEVAQNGISNFQQFQTFYGTGTYTTTAVDLDQNYYCFRLGVYDACVGANSSYSSIACSQIVSLDIKNGVNTLNWTSNPTGVKTISINRNSSNYIGIPYTKSYYDDAFPNITCNTDYKYYLVFNYTSGATSTSLEKSGKSFYTLAPKAIADVSSVTDGQAVNLTWLADPNQAPLLAPNTYSILKSTARSIAYSQIGTVIKTLTYQDNAYVPYSTCYKINYTDVCANNIAGGIEACPIVLQGTIDKKNVINLEWSAYTGWQNGVNTYQVDKFAKDGTLLNSTKVSTTTFTDDQTDLVNQTVSYKITAIANDASLIPSTSNIIKITKEANLFYPNVFTPNGDGLNDTFTVSGQFINKIDLKIYDRWGGLLFSTETNEPWNGYINGKLLNEGAYIWKAIVTDLAGQTFSHTGTIFLLTKSK